VKRIDLNADVGEGFDDAALMPSLTSANVAAGGHAGDDAGIARTVALARAHGVAVGAHPSYPDREGAGRRPMELSAAELEATLREQLARVRRAAGALAHVKLHGALYHRAAESLDVARAVVRALDRGAVVVAQPGAAVLEAAREAGLKVATEAFADRAYEPGGKLRSRALPGALVTDPAAAAAQAVRLAPGVQTLCVHSDTPGAAAIAAAVRAALEQAGWRVAALGEP